MKKQLLAASTALSLLLTGCASLLEREYIDVTPHSTHPTAEEDPSVFRTESYQELVNALIYLVFQGKETGTVHLYSDTETAEADLAAACLEVIQEAPLGAYAVEDIRYTVDTVVGYSEARVQIAYRRTREQVASIVRVTGAAAICEELEKALNAFNTQLVLWVSYFDGTEDSIRALLQEAYLADPASALDLPEADIVLYPDTGRQRIMEITLRYHLDQEELERRRDLLILNCQRIVQTLGDSQGDQQVLDAAQAILRSGGYRPTGGSTAYHALLGGGGDSQGMALAMALLCRELNVDCYVAEGTLNGRPHYWNTLRLEDGWAHLDLSYPLDQDAPFRTDDQLEQGGYAWEAGSLPAAPGPS